jgi:hypothetical protein
MKNLPNFFQKRTPTIFISYRRKDSEAHAGRLRDNLKNYFRRQPKNYFKQKAVVFRDYDDIPPTVNYVEYIQSSIKSSAVFIHIIGEKWLNMVDPQTGGRRLDNPEDSVRMEITTALEAKIPIIPVLVDDAEMPGKNDLPDELKELAFKSAEEVNEPDWDDKVKRLIETIEKVLQQQNNSFDYRKIIIAAVLILIIGIAGLWLLRKLNPNNIVDGVVNNQNNIAHPTPSPTVQSEMALAKCKTFIPLPENGDGYVTFGREEEDGIKGIDQWGCESTIDAIKKIAAEWKKNYPDAVPIQIGDISKKGGGNPAKTIGHKSGTVFNIRPLRKDTTPAGASPNDDKTEKDYSGKLTRNLVCLIAELYPKASISFNDPRIFIDQKPCKNKSLTYKYESDSVLVIDLQPENK